MLFYDVISGMLTRPAGHEATRPKIFFEAKAKATMYEAKAEARHVRKQLSVYILYEHED